VSIPPLLTSMSDPCGVHQSTPYPWRLTSVDAIAAFGDLLTAEALNSLT
jgi:hypothetical protein